MRSPVLSLIAIMGITAAVIAVVLLPAQHTAAGGSAKPHPEVAKAATPMILQEADGDQLVHRAGPLRGVPFTIKVDGQAGNSEDFFVFSETLAPGQTIPFHKHENAEELLILPGTGSERDRWR
jgi:hypothetical protein